MPTTTIGRNEDGEATVRYWDVYRQQWVETLATLVSDQALATLSQAERDAIAATRADELGLSVVEEHD